MSVSRKRNMGIHGKLAVYMSTGFLLVLMIVLLLFLESYWSSMRQQLLYSLEQNNQQNVQSIADKME